MTGKETDIAEARQLIVDHYGCRTSCIDDVDSIKNVIHMVCQCIGAGIVEECYHKFSPMGISAVAVITPSHISIHTWPEYGYTGRDMPPSHRDVKGRAGREKAD